jgi:hypothetical protein
MRCGAFGGGKLVVNTGPVNGSIWSWPKVCRALMIAAEFALVASTEKVTIGGFGGVVRLSVASMPSSDGKKLSMTTQKAAGNVAKAAGNIAGKTFEISSSLPKVLFWICSEHVFARRAAGLTVRLPCTYPSSSSE